MEVYIDIIFLINFFIDFLLLILVGKIIKNKIRAFRIILASCISSMITCFYYIFPITNKILDGVVAYVLISVIMIFVAFDVKKIKDILRVILILFLCTFLFGGILKWIYYETPVTYYVWAIWKDDSVIRIGLGNFLLIIFFIYLLLQIIFIKLLNKKKKEDSIYKIKIEINKKNVETKGFLDTGNNLYDSIFGKPVIVAEYSILKDIISKEYVEVLNEYLKDKSLNLYKITKNNLYNIKLIHFKSLGRKNGEMIAIICDNLYIQIDDKEVCKEKVIIALVDMELSKNGEYSVLLHRDLME